jgi:diguanylate cyclase (GGDEF)-like protein
MERALCIAAIACAAIAFAGWWRVRSRHGWLALRVRLVEQRERDTALAAREFVAASRGSSREVLAVLDLTLRRLDPAVDAVVAFVPDGDELRCVFSSGERALYYAGLRLPRDNATLVARAAVSRQPIELQGALPALLALDRAAVAVALAERDALIGVVYVSTSRAFAFENRNALVRTIDHAAVPYAIAVERERDRIEATCDALTGLPTASAFRARLADAIASAKLKDGRLAIWFIDTDGFKAVNDAFGHAAGDAVLRELAGLLRAHTLDGVDLTGRSGGDELCAMLSSVAKTIAVERAQALCDAVRRHVFEPNVRITVSIGVASCPLDAVEVNELLEVADAAMYYSKRCGRNRVAFAVERTSFRTLH